MRDSIRNRLNESPESQLEGLAEHIAAKLQSGESGFQFQDARPYWMYKDEDSTEYWYFSDSHDGVEKLARRIEQSGVAPGFKISEDFPGFGALSIARQVRDILMSK